MSKFIIENMQLIYGVYPNEKKRSDTNIPT